VIYLIYLKDREEDDRISDVGQRSADPNNIFADAPLSLFCKLAGGYEERGMAR
jgi:hypothetical protein